MKRRKFIELSSKFSIGSMLLPVLLSSSCRDEELFEELNYDRKVIIVGAGAAGMYAAYILQSRGIEYEILEASSKVGGRLGKLEGFADFTLDTGAQWLHGKNNILGDLIKSTGTKIKLDNSDTKYWFQEGLQKSLPRNIAGIFEEEEGLLDVSFQDFAIQKGFGEEYKYIVERMAGDQGASANQLSAKGNYRDEEYWSSGRNDFKFRESFFDLFDQHILPSINKHIQLNTVVSKIDYSGNAIVVTDQQNNLHIADKVIVSVPITILQDEDIQFVPSLNTDKISAFKDIGMGAGMKVFLKFSNAFYDGNIIGGKVCAAYADEKEKKIGNDHVLLAFIMGQQAERLTALGSNQAIVNELLGELDTMYNGQASANFISSHVENWTTNPFVRGAYSYAKVGMREDSRRIAAQSVNQKIFFAGEAMNLNGHHQTVHGAVETGYREVINLLNSLKK